MAYHSLFPALGSIARDTGTVTTVSLASNQTSGVFSATGETLNFSYQFEMVTGTASGTFAVQVSNDPRLFDPNYATSALWETAQSVSFTSGVVTGTSNTGCFVTVQNAARFSRCKWTQTGGTGTGWAYGCGVSL